MIWFFDSWFGWLQTMKYFKDMYPEYDYIFLADTKNCPYGDKSEKEIRDLTFRWLNRLFDHGATIVILACNTAAAYAIRSRQTLYPEKKVLSITIPGIEKILHEKHTTGNIGILATQATIMSNIYTDLFFRFGGKDNPDFQFVMAPKLVNIVENGFQDKKEIQETINTYLSKFSNIKYLILGCTHFPVLMDQFKKQFSWEIIDPSMEAAKKFWPYLKKHEELHKKLSKNSSVKCYTTGPEEKFMTTWSRIFWSAIHATHIEL